MSSHCEVYESYERQTRATYDAVSNRASSSSLGGGHHRRQPQRFGNPAVGHKAQDAGAVHKIINLLGLTGGRHSYEDSNAYEDYDTVSQNILVWITHPRVSDIQKRMTKLTFSTQYWLFLGVGIYINCTIFSIFSRME